MHILYSDKIGEWIARIFASATFKDLEEYREKVRNVLRQMGHEYVAVEYFVPEDKKSFGKFF